MSQFFELTFSNQNTAKAMCVDQRSDLAAALHQLDLSVARPVLVLVGGANGLSVETMESLQFLFQQIICPIIKRINGVVVDGGTDAGVMRLMGQARSETEGTFPLVGVVVQPKAILPEMVLVDANTHVDRAVDADAAELEPHHTHFLLVPGNNWGDEAGWIAQVATLLARGAPSMTVLINGGAIALHQDVPHSIQQQRPVLVIAGSGRSADRLADALLHPLKDPEIQPLVESGLLTAIKLQEHPNLLKAILQRMLETFS